MISSAERTLEIGVSIAGFRAVPEGNAFLLSVAKATSPGDPKNKGKMVRVGDIRQLKL
jgi:hypothetical protein